MPGGSSNVEAYESYTAQQLNALIKLSALLCKWFTIPVDRHNLVGHSELDKQKQDPGPRFPWDALLSGIKRELATGSGDDGAMLDLATQIKRLKDDVILRDDIIRGLQRRIEVIGPILDKAKIDAKLGSVAIVGVALDRIAAILDLKKPAP